MPETTHKPNRTARPCTVCKAMHQAGGAACTNCREFAVQCVGLRPGDLGQVVRCQNYTANRKRVCGECLG